MAIISPEDAAQLKEIFAQQLTRDVTLVHYTQRESRIIVPGVVPCATCRDNVELLEELVAIDDHLHLEMHDFKAEADVAERAGIDKIPATVVRGADGGERARFFGVPAGYEFTTLLEDILEVGGAGSQLSAQSASAIAGLGSDVHIQVFVTPTCPYCPAAVRMGHALALASERVTADMVMSTEFPHVSQRYGVLAVPKVVINETRSFEGALPEEQFVEQVVAAASGAEAPAGELTAE
jgi:glutaredoxin-like protein